jgi:uncharacterized protein (TIGR02453 family)
MRTTDTPRDASDDEAARQFGHHGGMAFQGWPAEAVTFFEGLEADNTKTYWQSRKAIYEECVRAPMEALLGELEDDFGPGQVFRPHRDTRFSTDKTPYKLNCAAHLRDGYVSFSADEVFAGSGLYMPDSAALQRYRAAVDDERSGTALEAIVLLLREDGYQVDAHDVLKTAPRGYAKDHPRIDLLRQKGVVMSKSWPVGAWTRSSKARDRIVACLTAARPLNDWIAAHVGA